MGMDPKRKVIKKWIVGHTDHTAWPESKVAISVDPENGGFWILCPLVGEVAAESKGSCAKAWRQLYAQARSHEQEWEQIIVVKLINLDRWRAKEDDQYGMYLGFEQIIRIERTVVTAMTVPESSWEKPREVKRTLYREFGAGCDGGKPTTEDGAYVDYNTGNNRERVPQSGAKILPYQEETWQSLMAMKAGLRQMNARVKDLMKGDANEVSKRLAALPAGRALMAPEE